MFSVYSKNKGIGLTFPILLEGSVYTYVCVLCAFSIFILDLRSIFENHSRHKLVIFIYIYKVISMLVYDGFNKSS